MGYSHPNRLLEELTSQEISEWIAYDKLEPIDIEYRQDLRFGILNSTIVNFFSSVFAKKGKTPKQWTPEDFMPKFEKKKEVSEKELITKLKTWALSTRGKK